MVHFASSNSYKSRLFSALLKPYGVSFDCVSLELTEPQSCSLEDIVRSKAVEAFRLLDQPLFVHDASWEIAALRGFPGPYMKYVNHVLSPLDILALLRDKDDRSVRIIDTFGCADQDGLISVFQASFSAIMSNDPQGMGSSVDQLTILAGATKPLSLLSDRQRLQLIGQSPVWNQLANWIKTQELPDTRAA